MTPRTILYTCVFVLIFSPAISQWTKTKGPTSGITQEIFKIDSYLFVNGNAGGIFRSSDNGLTWTAVNNGLPANPHCWTLKASGNLMYAAIGSEGVYRSNDYGESWVKPSAQLDYRTIYALDISGSDVYAGDSEGGLYYSSDAGSTWVFFQGLTQPSQIRTFEAIGDTLWIGAEALYYSLNHGQSWTKVNVDIGPNGVTRITLGGNYLYAGAYDMQHSGALYISSDLGKSWQKDGVYNGTITSLYAEGTDVYMGVANSHFYHSADAGGAWTYTNFPMPFVTITDIFRTEGTVYACTTEGLFASTDNGTTWTRRADGIINQIVRHVAVYGTKIFSSTERQGVYVSGDQGESWTQKNSGLEPGWMDVAGFHVAGDKILAGTSNGVFVSNDAGDTWQKVLTLDINENVHSISGAGSHVLATTGKGCYVSDNAGETWTLKGEATMGGRHLMTSLVKGDTIVVGSYNEIFISSDAGETWQLRKVQSSFFSPTDMAINGTLLMIATYQGLFLSSDLGTTWTTSSGLPSPVVDITTSDNILLAGTAQGVYYSTDSGSSWQAGNRDLNNQDVYSVVTDGKYYYGGTYGSGVWRIAVDNLGTPCEVPLPNIPVLVENCGVINISNFDTGNIEWYNNGVRTAFSGQTLSVASSGQYFVKLSNECGTVISNTIKIDGAPGLELKPVVELRCDELALMNFAGEDLVWYKDGQVIKSASGPTLQLTEAGSYSVEVRDACGSSFSDPTYYSGKEEFKMYNVISPNGDGYNDYYFVPQSFLGSPLRILNRWGSIIYQDSSYNNTWMPVGLAHGRYYYIIDHPCYGAIKGSFTVI